MEFQFSRYCYRNIMYYIFPSNLANPWAVYKKCAPPSSFQFSIVLSKGTINLCTEFVKERSRFGSIGKAINPSQKFSSPVQRLPAKFGPEQAGSPPTIGSTDKRTGFQQRNRIAINPLPSPYLAVSFSSLSLSSSPYFFPFIGRPLCPTRRLAVP